VAPTEVVLALPETASREQVVSNLFQQAWLVYEEMAVTTNPLAITSSGVVTQKVAAHKLAIMGSTGTLPTGSQGRRVTTFAAGPSFWAIYDHGSEAVDTVNTDIGEVLVRMSYEPTENKVPGGWRCRVEWGDVDWGKPQPLPGRSPGTSDRP
jgi:hypothetical protein